jgi:hypothetical protein
MLISSVPRFNSEAGAASFHRDYDAIYRSPMRTL